MIMRLAIAVILWGILASGSAQIKVVEHNANAQAQALLAQARSAIGNTNIQTLSVKGKIRRFIKYVEVASLTKVNEKEKTLTSKIEFDFSFPDKFRLKQKISQLNGFNYDFYSITNGKESWVYPQPVAPSVRGNRNIVNVEDAEKSLLQQEQIARSNLGRFTLIWLLQSLPAWPFEFSYVGKASAENAFSDVLLIRDTDGVKSLLLLDQQTHLPTVLNETVIAPQFIPVIPTGFGFDRRFNRALIARVREERQARMKPPQPISVQMRLSERRVVGGLNLPHRITTLHNGVPVEEVEFDEFEINRPINPNKFEEKRPALK